MAKKDKKPKLPKKVGGVKLPKELRKSASVVAEIAQNPIARDVVSAALVAGAAALTKRRAKDASASSAATGKTGNDLDGLISQGKEVGNILAQGVTAFFNSLMKPAEKKAGSDAKQGPSEAAPAKPATAKRPAARRPAAKPAATSKARAKPKPTS
jgi:hypothetical protein